MRTISAFGARENTSSIQCTAPTSHMTRPTYLSWQSCRRPRRILPYGASFQLSSCGSPSPRGTYVERRRAQGARACPDWSTILRTTTRMSRMRLRIPCLNVVLCTAADDALTRPQIECTRTSRNSSLATFPYWSSNLSTCNSRRSTVTLLSERTEFFAFR